MIKKAKLIKSACKFIFLKRYWLFLALTIVLFSLFSKCSPTVEKDGIYKGPEIDKAPLKPTKRKQTDTILVKFKPEVQPPTREKKLDKVAVGRVEKLRRLPVYKIRVKPEEFSQKIKELNKDNQIDYVEPDQFISALITPNDPFYDEQYGLLIIKAPQGWDLEIGSSNEIKIAVVDTGVQLSHPDLAGKISGGYDFINNDSVADDDHGHGTHVAGIAASMTNNAIGSAGVSWGAKIMPVKVLNSSGFGTYSTVSNGITYAADNEARVINLSLGGYSFSQTMQAATDYAYNRGTLVAAAAGNDGDSTVIYPAGNANVLGVAATDSSDKRASFSNYNVYVDVSAPGVNILSTYKGSRYAYMSGTSMAAPFASGLAALILSQNSTMDVSAVSDTITQHSDDLGATGRDNYYGYGRINAYYSLEWRPIIRFFVPSSGSYIKGTRAVSAAVADADGIAKVEFLVDDDVKAFDTEAPYSTYIDTLTLTNGLHVFGIRATDNKADESTLYNSVTVDNYRPKTYAPKRYRIRRGRVARLYWKVYDPFTGSRSYVKIYLKRRTYSRTKRKWFYRTVKTIKYGLTTINKLRYYRLRIKTRGKYKMYVYARDRAGNKQANIASNYVIVR